MGYRSNIIIGLHKTIMARNLVTNELPKFFKYEIPQQCGDSFYWKFEAYKWYVSFPEIAEMEAYFELLEQEATKHQECEQNSENQKESLFGAIRLGEGDDDEEEWGNPTAFGIESLSSLDSPAGALY